VRIGFRLIRYTALLSNQFRSTIHYPHTFVINYLRPFRPLGYRRRAHHQRPTQRAGTMQQSDHARNVHIPAVQSIYRTYAKGIVRLRQHGAFFVDRFFA